ncbi:MAG: PAS domain S-box protein [Tepidisphaerales bacterium]
MGSDTPSTIGGRRTTEMYVAGAAFAFLAVTIGVSGYFYIRYEGLAARQTAQDQLSAIADLKVREIAEWYKERQGDAAIVRDHPLSGDVVTQFLANPNQGTVRQKLQAWMETRRRARGYRDVVLYNAGGVPLVWAAPGGSSAQAPSASLGKHFQAAILAKDVLTTDLHRSQVDPKLIHFSLWIPIGVKPAANAPADAVLRLRIDAAEFLYPLIQSWPTPSRTAETVLLRREGDDVVYLNELRHRSNTALNLRVPINTPKRAPTTMAVTGREGIAEGLDYRNVPVLAAMRAVPGTPWFIVAKVDQEEIYGPLRHRAWTTGVAVGLAILLAATGLGLTWRQRENHWLRRQIGERERSGLALKEREAHFRLLYEQAPVGYQSLDVDGNFLDVNPAWRSLLGYARDEVIGRWFGDFLVPAQRDLFRERFPRFMAAGETRGVEFEMLKKDGSHILVSIDGRIGHTVDGGFERTHCVLHDITDRKQAEEARLATIELLRICNQARDQRELLRELTGYFQQFTGCEAVGVRLREDDDFPYYETRGFPAEFVRAESSLCTRDAAGQPVRDSAGNPVLDCMCGNILSGRFDPTKPFFTRHGSFWTNNTTQLLAGTTEADRQARTRNRCNGEGYESVALVPIRAYGQTLGLLQLNSKQAGRFGLERIQLIEQLADYVAIAVAKLQADEALRHSDDWHRTILQTAMDGFWLVDTRGRLLEVNETYCRMSGYGRQELLAMCVADLESVETADEIVARTQKVMIQGQARFESRHRRKDGRIFDVEVSVQYRAVNGRLVAFLRDVTERKEIEKRIELLKHSVDVHYDGAYWTDSQGKLIYVNDRGCKVLGYELGELTGKMLDAVNPRATAERMKGVWETLRRDGFYKGESLHRRKDGTEFPVEVITSYIRFRGEEYTCGFARDISERKRMEETLRASEEHYRSLFEHMLNGFAYCRMLFEQGHPHDFIYLEANSAFESLTGLKNVVGKRVSEIIPGLRESDPELFEIYGRVALTGKPEKFERYVQGLQMWFAISVYSPKKEHFAAVFDVVTDRKRAEEGLRRSEAELDAIFENAPVAMLLVDGGRTVRKANRAAEKLAGRDLADIVGKRGGDALRCVGALNDAGGCGFGPDCEGCAVRRTVMDTFETGRPHSQVEATLTVAHGEAAREVSLVMSTALLGAGGEGTTTNPGGPDPCTAGAVTPRGTAAEDCGPPGKTVTPGSERMVLVCIVDVTERKQLEAQLLQAHKLEAIGRLAAGIAHDFRNQLTVIRGYSEMLLRKSLIKDGRENLVGEVLNAAQRGTQLTGQLLAFSRKDMLQPSVVHLGKVVADLAGPMSRLVGEDVVTTTTGGGPDLLADIAVAQFEHAMMNLAANARDAMAEGGELTIDTACVELDRRSAGLLPDAKPGPYVRVTVRDTGMGMDLATQSRLFEPFFTTKQRGQGTGLGLPMVYGFVRQSGGFITVDSEPGQGASFHLHFPRVSAVAGVEPRGVAQADVRPGSDVARGTETILIVEDEEPIRWLVTQCLREAGYTVIPTGDARQAIEAAETGESGIDMLITDVVMPGASGVELARRVRQKRPEIPVLFVSGYGGDDLSKRGVDLQRAELLVKPFRHATLLETVRRMLDARMPGSA